MVGSLLARVVIGVMVGGVVGGTAVAVYKYITKDTIRDDVNKRLDNSDIFNKAFQAEVKKKSENGQTVSVDILDDMDNPVAEMDITGDEISSDIHVGDIILLREAS